jgi:hypothetical protein
MIKIVKDKSGISYVKTAVIILVISMLFSVVFTYISLMITVSRTRDDTQRVLDSFIIENASEIYDSVKNGNNTTLNNDYSNEFRKRVFNELWLMQVGGSPMYHSGTDGKVIFYYDNPVTTTIRSDVLELKTQYEIVMPVSFAGQKLFDLRIPMEVKSLYIMK